MGTDWKLIRELMNSAIDSCELIEKLDVSGSERSATNKVGEQEVTVWEYLQSAWIYPENSSYMITRARHSLGENKPFTSELARTLQGTALFCSELIGATNLDTPVKDINPHSTKEKSIRTLTLDLINWYKDDFVVGIRNAIDKLRK